MNEVKEKEYRFVISLTNIHTEATICIFRSKTYNNIEAMSRGVNSVFCEMENNSNFNMRIDIYENVEENVEKYRGYFQLTPDGTLVACKRNEKGAEVLLEDERSEEN